jgi:glycosyltransferase involved in cell wall biosynthesis
MRLLLINYEYPPVGGGAATAVYELARVLAGLGHRPAVLTARYHSRRPEHLPAGVKLFEVPARRKRADHCTLAEMASFVGGALPRVRGIVRREQIEGMIAFFSMPCGPIAWWGWRATGVPYVISLRGGDVPGNEPSLALAHCLLRFLRHAVFRRARAIVANSEGLRLQAEAADPFSVRVIPNGVDSDFWCPPEQRPTLPPIRFLFAGRLQPQKNLPRLFAEAAALAAQGLPPFELHIVGDGPERAGLAQMAAELHLADRVTWHGWLNRAHLRDLYRSCHCLVNPSDYEGMPNVVLEAMACGLPVVASNVPGNNTLVIPGKTGFLFDPADPGALRPALAQILNDRAQARTLGEHGRQRVMAEFSWARVAQSYLELLSSET